jgi:hypothetical protein
MSRINYGRVLSGGLLAGVILTAAEFLLTGLFIRHRWLEALERLGVEAPGVGVTIMYVFMTLILGVVIVWLYAAIRPRYGAGPRTAVCAGLLVWFLVWLWGFAGGTIWGFFPVDLVVIVCVWGLVEVVLASLAGAWLYREEDEVQTAEIAM